MVREPDIILDMDYGVDDAIMCRIEGRTFQIHCLRNGNLRLIPVSISTETRCPVIIAGERCGERVGHEGKHCWAGGD